MAFKCNRSDLQQTGGIILEGQTKNPQSIPKILTYLNSYDFAATARNLQLIKPSTLALH